MTHARSRFTLAAAAALALVISSIVPDAAAADGEDSYTSTVGELTVTVTRRDATAAPGSSVSRAMPSSGLEGTAGTLTEGFDDVTTLPGSGWALINRSDPVGQSNWYQGDTQLFPAHEGAPSSYIAADLFNSGSNGTISNWLLTPEVTIVEGTVLQFTTRTIANSPRPDRLELRASLQGESTDVGATATSVGDFTMLLTTINEPLVQGGYPPAWTTLTLTVTEVPEPLNTGRFALRYFVTDAGEQGQNGFYIGIDTLSVSNPPLIDVDPESLSATLPQGALETLSLNVANAGSDTLQWEFSDELFRRDSFEFPPSGSTGVAAAVMDPQGEFAYFGINNTRVDESFLVAADLEPFELDGLMGTPDADSVGPAVIDPQGNFAYFGFNTSPARVVKADLVERELVGTIILEPDEILLEAAVMDLQGGFAYFGTFTSPGRVVKIDLTTFQRVGVLTLPASIEFLMSGVIAPGGQFAYFGASVDDVAGVVKVNLETFSLEDADSFVDVLGAPMSAAIDPAGEFAYFGMSHPSAWQVVKFDLALFNEAAVIQGVDTNLISTALMDPLGEYAYFGTDTHPGTVLKVDLDPFEEVEAISLVGSEHVLSAVIDPAGTFAYFGAGVWTVKVQLRLPDCVLPGWLSVDTAGGSLPGGQAQAVDVTFDATGLTLGEHTANVCIVGNDPTRPVVKVPVTLTVTDPPVLAFEPASLAFGDVAVGTSSSPITAVLHNSGAGEATNLIFSFAGEDFTFDTGACGGSLPAGGSCPVSVTFAPAGPGEVTGLLSAGGNGGNTAQLGVSGNGVDPPPVIDVDPDSVSSTLEPGEVAVENVAIANLGTASLNWDVAQDVEVFQRIGGIRLNPGEGDVLSAVIDPAGQFAYFGTNTEPGRVIKVELETFRQVDAIYLESGENGLLSAVIDPAGQFAYFGTDTAPGRVVKIDLNTFERVGAIILDAGQDGLWSAVIDPDGTHAYFGTNTNPGRVARIDLASFVPDGVVTLVGAESFLRSAVIDPAGAFAYFGTDTFPGRVIKIDLDPFARVDAMTAANGENNLVAAVIDPAGTFAYFGTDTDPGRVVKIQLANMVHFGSLTLAQGENQLSAAVIDPDGEFAYFGTQTDPGRVVKIDLDPFARSGAITLNDGENDLWRAVIDPASEHAYFATRDDPGRVVKVGLNRPDCTLPAWLGAPLNGGSVPGGGQQIRSLTLDAGGLEPGEYAANMCLASNDPATPLVAVPVTLTVTPPAVPALVFDPASLAFGDVELGGSATRTATLGNEGGVAASELLFGALGNGFTADTSACGDTLPSGGSCVVGVTFAPTVAGPVNATLEVGSAEGATAALALAGRGVSKTEVFAPVALEVDYRALPSSDGNRVFEPGEIVDVAPAWRHDGLFEQSLSGAASAFTGPAGPSYDLVAGEATYGLVQPAAIASCRETEVCYQMGIGPEGVPRPALHWDAGFAETVSDASSSTWTLHVGGSFTDVPPAGLFYPFVEALLHHGVTGGCGDSRYCPLRVTSRQHVAVLALRALEGAGYTPPPCEADTQIFDDVPFDSPFCPWVEELFRRGGTAGCGGGIYCPGDALTRGQTAVVLLKTLEGPDYAPGACGGVFADVDCSSPFAAWIEDLYERGVTGGCDAEPLTYCPAQAVNRRQIAVFLGRTFGLTLYGP